MINIFRLMIYKEKKQCFKRSNYNCLITLSLHNFFTQTFEKSIRNFPIGFEPESVNENLFSSDLSYISSHKKAFSYLNFV